MSSLTVVIEGEVNTQVTVTELDDGSLRFDVQVLDTGSIGDLRALHFDLADDSLASSLSVTGDDITDNAFYADKVGMLGQDTNRNGEVLNDYGKFEGGVEFGTTEISGDDIQTTSFTLSSSDRDLALDDIYLQDFGLRLTSVGEDGGEREDSLKLGDIAKEEPGAIDDDFLATNENLALSGPNLLENDSDDILAVTAVDGDADNVGAEIEALSEGGRLGSLLVQSDGTLFFDPGGAFVDLAQGEWDTVAATYQATDGVGGYDTASLTITVWGIDEWGDPPVLG